PRGAATATSMVMVGSESASVGSSRLVISSVTVFLKKNDSPKSPRKMLPNQMKNILRGDFGESFFFKKTVTELITSRLEPTLALSLPTITIEVAVAAPLG